MDNFKIVYKLLHALDKAADYDEPDLSSISAENLGISKSRWIMIWQAILDKGYVAGVKYVNTAASEDIVFINPRLTLDGMEYLETNSMMSKLARAAKGIKDMVPGL